MGNKYYIYAHINPVKNEIFYIGKGTGNRKIRKERNPFWGNTVKKYGYIIDILEEGLTEAEAFEREKFYIQKIGRRDLGKGPLVNLTDGGEGGSNPSESTREKMRIAHTGKVQSEETIAKRISKTTGLKRSKEFGEQISERQKGEKNHFYGKKFTQEHKEKIGKASKGRTHTEETKKKMSEAQKNKSEETRKKLSEAHKGKTKFKNEEERLEAIKLSKLKYKNKIKQLKNKENEK
jgi:hypothetical protein